MKNSVRVLQEISDYLPPELLMEILTMLPVKTLLRFTSVCKTWYSLINSPNFISSHLNRTISNKTHTRLLVRNVDDMDQYSIPIDNPTDTKKLKPSDKLKLPFRPLKCNLRFNIIGTCNGLVCLSDDAKIYSDSIFLWNPSIQKYVELPHPNITFESLGWCPYQHTLGFGFNPVTKDYTVVRVVSLKEGYNPEPLPPPKVEIYELSTGSWRYISAHDLSHVIKERTQQVLLNSVVHWIGQDYDMIVSFDLKNETFGVMKVPFSVKSGWCARAHVMQFGELVSLIDQGWDERYCYMWVMEEYGVENTWTRRFKIDLKSLGPELGYGYSLIRKDDDVVLVINRDKYGDLVSYNPMTRYSKKLNIHGLPEFFCVESYMESLVL